MRSKPAELSAGLVAVKGAAAPSPDMPGRAGAALAAVPPPAPEAAQSASSKAAFKPPARRAKAEPAEEKEANLAPLNFRIPASFRREFKTYAAQHNKKLNQLLYESFAALKAKHAD